MNLVAQDPTSDPQADNHQDDDKPLWRERERGRKEREREEERGMVVLFAVQVIN